jgi:hypothetical protein
VKMLVTGPNSEPSEIKLGWSVPTTGAHPSADGDPRIWGVLAPSGPKPALYALRLKPHAPLP